MQLDEADRGFAYAQDAPLDMRMDQTTGVSAAEVLNTYPPGELVRILRAYGEEKQAKRIVAAIVREREKEPFTHSARLVELIRDALPQAAKRTGGNQAKRTFQALRIEVNGELSVLERAIPAAVKALDVDGPDRRAVVPLPGGPAGQAGVRGGCRHHRAARAAGRPRALPAPAQAAHARCPTPHRGGDRREPPCSPRGCAAPRDPGGSRVRRTGRREAPAGARAREE
ncbi:Ribosomal RNA small subunit methyltransferase H [Streptomyces griseomycini]